MYEEVYSIHKLILMIIGHYEFTVYLVHKSQSSVCPLSYTLTHSHFSGCHPRLVHRSQRGRGKQAVHNLHNRLHGRANDGRWSECSNTEWGLFRLLTFVISLIVHSSENWVWDMAMPCGRYGVLRSTKGFECNQIVISILFFILSTIFFLIKVEANDLWNRYQKKYHTETTHSAKLH